MLDIQKLNILTEQDLRFENYKMKSQKSFSKVFRNHYIFYKELEHDAIFTTVKSLNISNVRLALEDIQIFDRSILFGQSSTKLLSDFRFSDYDTKDFSDKFDIVSYNHYNYNVSDVELVVHSIDPVTNSVYNKLKVKSDF